jgi:membrane associated rhomboid family serine protease
MFIPYAVDAPFDHRPVVNWLVLLGIILVFVLQVATSEKQATEKSKKEIESPEEVFRVPTVEKEVATKQEEKKQTVTGPMARFALNGWGFGLFTYIWLHGGVLKGTVRLIGNLIFLWPFGNAVCAKLGNKLYLPVYLGFGLLAGVIHLALGVGPAVGACGVICGIVGMYIVLFPEDTMSCFFLFPRPMAVSISGCWFVLLWFVFDILATGLGGSTTYYAHILCFGAGVGLAVLMLKKKWLVMESDEKSLLQMLSRKEEEDLSFVASAKKEEKGKEEGGKKGEKEEKKDLEAVEKRPEIVDKAKAEPKKAVPEAEKPEDDFVRFRCECGHKIKVHKRDAGKAGRCPKCSRWLEAPRT